MRCIYEGSEFQWMQTWGVSLLGEEKAMRIMGNGYEGHFLIVFLLALLFTVILFGLIRRSNDPLVKVMTVLFTAVMATKEIMLSIAYGDQYRIVGETFNLYLSYSIIGPVISVIIFALSLVWVYRNKLIKLPEPTSFKINVLILLLVIPGWLFLSLGIQHNWTDVVGINFIYLQLTLLVLNWMGIFQYENKKKGFQFSQSVG